MAMTAAQRRTYDQIDRVVETWLGIGFITNGDGIRRSIIWDHHIPTREELEPLGTALAALLDDDPVRVTDLLTAKFNDA